MKVLGGTFEISMEEAGRVHYREGLHDYTFPIYEQDREIVIVPEPSEHRLRCFGCSVRQKRFTDSARRRITPRLVEFFHQPNRAVRLFENLDKTDPTAIYSSLFDERARASKVLDDAGLYAFRDYSSIELIKDIYGLSVCGIRKEERVQDVVVAMKRGFPQWHFSKVTHKEDGQRAGWKVAIHMFRRDRN